CPWRCSVRRGVQGHGERQRMQATDRDDGRGKLDGAAAGHGHRCDHGGMTSFASLPLKPALLSSVETLGYTTMTPVQAQSLPPMLEGRDVIAQAQTGSGKTAAFG